MTDHFLIPLHHPPTLIHVITITLVIIIVVKNAQFHIFQLSALVLAVSLGEEFKYWHQILCKLARYKPCQYTNITCTEKGSNTIWQQNCPCSSRQLAKNRGFNIRLATVTKKSSSSSKSSNDQQAWLRGRSIVIQPARCLNIFYSSRVFCQKAL